jgi:hypothetical protein
VRDSVRSFGEIPTVLLMWSVEFGLILLVVAVVVSRRLLHRANQHLSVEEKARLVDLSGGLSSYAILMVLPLVALLWLLSRHSSLPQEIVYLAYFGSATVFIVGVQIMNYRRLTSLGFPSPYTSQYAISRGVYMLGVLVFFAALVLELR